MSLNLNLGHASPSNQDANLDLTLHATMTEEERIELEIDLDAGNCGCSSDGSTVSWGDIAGKPTCVVSCAAIIQTILTNGYIRSVGDTATITLHVDEDGQLTANLKAISESVVAAGSSSKSVVIAVDQFGRTISVEETDINIDADHVTYGNSTVGETLDNLISGSGDKHYHHIQAVPSAAWTVVHNLNKRPSFVVKDTAGDTLIGFEITYTDNNTAILSFGSIVAGDAWVN